MTNYLTNKPAAKATAHFVFAHGAGAPVDAPFMNTISEGLATAGILVSRFEFPYVAKRRLTGNGCGPGSPKVLLETWRGVVQELKGAHPLFIGGKSMGTNDFSWEPGNGRQRSNLSPVPGLGNKMSV